MTAKSPHLLRFVLAIALFIGVVAAAASLGASPIGAAPPNPTYGTADVNGNDSEWNLSTDFYASMYQAFNPSKPALASGYLRYDCSTGTVYVLVLQNTVDGTTIPLLTAPGNAWATISSISGKVYVDSSDIGATSPPQFSWIGLDYNNMPSGSLNDGHPDAQGYEADFKLSPGNYTQIVVHVEGYYSGLGATAGFSTATGSTVAIDIPTSCTNGGSATATPTTGATATPTTGATNTPTVSATNTPTAGPTDTPTAVATPTNTPVPTDTPTAVDTPTDTPVPTPTSTPVDTPTDTPVPTDTPTTVPTPTDTPVPTATSTPVDTPTDTPVPTATSTPVNTPTDTPVPTATSTPVDTPTDTPVPTATRTPVATPTHTPVATATSVSTQTPTEVPTPTETPVPGQDVTLTGPSASDPGLSSFTRTYHWSVSKSANPMTVDQLEGDATIHYTVQVTETGYVDSGWVLDGRVTLANPGGFGLSGISLTDSVDNGGACSVINATGIDIPANGTVTRSYHCDWTSPPTATAGIDTATAHWNSAINHTPNGSASVQTAFSFTTPTTEIALQVNGIDPSVTASDDMVPVLGKLTATDTRPFTSATYNYSVSLSVPTSGCKRYENMATLIETGQTASQSVSICKQSAVPATPTSTAVASPSATDTPVAPGGPTPTNTPVPGVTSTGVPATTATPTPTIDPSTPTSVPTPTATAGHKPNGGKTKTPTSRRGRARKGPSTSLFYIFPRPIVRPNTGGGGTYVYTSAHGRALTQPHTKHLVIGSRQVGRKPSLPVALPNTGGAARAGQ